MKGFVLLLLVAVLLVAVIAEAKRHHGKHAKKATKKPKEELDMVAEDEKNIIVKDKEAQLEAESVLKDPCSKVRCGPGRECVINDDMTATCEGVGTCQPETNPRRKVCCNHNQTCNSDCELYKMRCFCEGREGRLQGRKI
uniref:Putative matricellular protein osteonectin/sparc/bm-40 n=1 Tax=Ixodes scapularis TaxID=6945 RepID=A0A4D5RVL7_IXOSC